MPGTEETYAGFRDVSTDSVTNLALELWDALPSDGYHHTAVIPVLFTLFLLDTDEEHRL